MSRARAGASPPGGRLVLLGASNVARGLPKITALARAACGGPIEVHAAVGHGRSYGMRSSFMGVRRRAIRECGVLEAVAGGPKLPTCALVTDIGADLLYGADPHQMVDWVMECVDALRAAGVRVRLTQLPVHCLDTIGPARYRLFRTLFFPRCRLTLRELGERALAANSQIIFAAQQRGVACAPLASEWYGFDPIHIAPRRAWEAWGALVGGMFDAPSPNPSSAAPRGPAASRRPAKVRGFWPFLPPVRARQALRDGTTITLY